MANFGYQSKAIISGVSTRPYALREDGHMEDNASNCMLSPKFGLAKRPGTTYLQTIEANSAISDLAFFPISTDDKEKVVCGVAASNWSVYDGDGDRSSVTFFPSSLDSASTAVSKYTAAGATFSPTKLSTTTIGDVTFIADSAVVPRMLTSTWDGYTDTANDGDRSGTVSVTNDDAFALWMKNVPATSSVGTPLSVTVIEERSSTPYRYDVAFFVKKDYSSQKLDLNGTITSTTSGYRFTHGENGNCYPTSLNVAESVGYMLSRHRTGGNSAGNYIVQASNLGTASYASGDNSSLKNGTAVVLGRYVNQNEGTLLSVGIGSSDGTGEDAMVSAFRSVNDVSELPPISFIDHTLKVGSQELPGGYYMRFISDEVSQSAFVNNASGYASTQPEFTSTTKTSRKGHWEEYCGTGVTQNLDGATMPLLLVTRPDNSYALMEARESFVVNDDSAGVNFVGGADDYFTVTNFDAGFNDGQYTSPLVAGDSIQFTVGGSNFPSELALNTTYYIRTATYDTGSSLWRYTLQATKATATQISVTAGNATSCKLKLTTYDDFAWSKRVAGDDETNPVPPFVDTAITSMFNFQDRLGIITDGSVTFSGTGDYFNFFKTTVRDLDASDPFTASPNLERGDRLKGAIPYERDLVLTSTTAQYTLKAGEGLSPTSAAIVNASRVRVSPYMDPTIVGDSIYLVNDQEDASTVTALKSGDQANTKFVPFDTSVNTPGYLPRGPRKLAGSSTHNMLFYLDDTESTSIYVYTWMDSKEGRIQSAWTKWDFGTDFLIKDIIVQGDRLYMVVNTNSMVTLEYIDLDLTSTDSLLSSTLQTNFGSCLIDHKTHNTAATSDRTGTHGGIYSEATSSGDTVIKLKWRLTDNNKANVVIVKSDGTVYEYGSDDSANTISVTVSASGDTLTNGTTSSSTMTKLVLNGVDITSSDYFVGLKYTMTAPYGPFIPSTQQGPLSGRNIFTKGGRLTYSQANEFKVTVTHDQPYTQTVSSGTTTATKSGDVMFAIRKHLPDLAFTITNEKPWNSLFQILKYDYVVQEIAGG